MAEVKFSKNGYTDKFGDFINATWFLYDERLYIKINDNEALNVADDMLEYFGEDDAIRVITTSQISIEVNNA